jgi:protocatechuate 3,4-dioxygenase beta subunit
VKYQNRKEHARMAVAPRTFFFATIFSALLLAMPLTARAQYAVPEPTPATGVVEGSVLDAQNNRAVPRASVKLMGLKGAGSKSTRADGNGHFIFEQVDAGKYKLAAQRQGYFSDERKQGYQPTFEIADGQHLKNMPVRLMPTAVVSGEVVDEYNDPVQNVQVQLFARKFQHGELRLLPAGSAFTDDRGAYRVSGVRPGNYYLLAEPKSVEDLAVFNNARQGPDAAVFSPESEGQRPFTYAPLFYPSTGDFKQAQALELSPGDELSANFIFMSAPVVSIQGRVTNGLTGGPAGAAVVSAAWTEYVEGKGTPARVSPTDGTFEVSGIAPGTYTLRASFTLDGDSFTGEQTVIVGDQGVNNVEISAVPDFAATGLVTITGMVRTAPNQIAIEFAGEGSTPTVRAGATSPQYKFKLALRPDHRYYANLRNLPDDYYLKSVAIYGHDVPTDNVVVSGRRGEIELVVSPAGGHIEGVLLDAKDQPSRGSVLLIPNVPQPGPPDLFRRTNADSKGKFTIRGVTPGSYRLLALENEDVDAEINAPDFLDRIGNRGSTVTVDEKGNYTIQIKLEAAESR